MVSKENSTFLDTYIKVLNKCMHNFRQERMLEAQKGDFIFSLKEIDKGSFNKSICLVYEYLNC